MRLQVDLIPMAAAAGFILCTDGRGYFTAREDFTDVHRHAHRDAAVDDFRARAGLIKENRNAR